MKAQDLKNSILQMAVQGKLVPQDPADEPASALLERIRQERAKLIKEKKIKTPKGGESVIYRGSDGSHYEKRGNSEPVCIDDEIPFEIPESWEWARVSALFVVNNGFTPSKSKSEFWKDGTIPWFTARDIQRQGRYIFSTEAKITPEALGPKRQINPADTVLLCCTASVGEVAIARIPVVTNQQYNALVQPQEAECRLTPEYVLTWAQLQKKALLSVAGITTFPFVSVGKLEQFMVPIPPLAEQQRIVERIDELMPLVEEYGELEDAREALDAALPDRLRKSILQMAVQGQLVEQDPVDEPASILLESIREERAELIKQQKIKAPKGGESVIYREGGSWYERHGKSEPVCIEDEIPFDIPESWEWTRLGSLLQLISDGTHKTPDYKDSGVLFLSVQNVSKGYFDLTKVKYVSKEDHEKLCKRVRPQNGDILLCRIGTLGKPIIVDVDFDFSIFVSLGLLRPIERSVTAWIVSCIDSPHGANWIRNVKVGGGTHTFKINLGDIPNFTVPIPPLAEQRRIVERVDELMAFIN